MGRWWHPFQADVSQLPELPACQHLRLPEGFGLVRSRRPAFSACLTDQLVLVALVGHRHCCWVLASSAFSPENRIQGISHLFCFSSQTIVSEGVGWFSTNQVPFWRFCITKIIHLAGASLACTLRTGNYAREKTAEHD